MGSEFDANYSRLKSFLILFLLIFFIYTCEVMIVAEPRTEQIDDFGGMFKDDSVETLEQPSTNVFSLLIEGISSIVGYIYGYIVFIFQMLTFTLPNIPLWMTYIMLPIMMVLIIIEIYLFIDVIYAIVKALPFTWKKDICFISFTGEL